jgi:hypothetical protein
VFEIVVLESIDVGFDHQVRGLHTPKFISGAMAKP